MKTTTTLVATIATALLATLPAAAEGDQACAEAGPAGCLDAAAGQAGQGVETVTSYPHCTWFWYSVSPPGVSVHPDCLLPPPAPLEGPYRALMGLLP